MCAKPNNQIEVEFLDDGTVKVTTATFDGPKHSSAEAFLRDIAAALGPTTRQRKPHAHSHTHEHDHDHETEGHHEH